MASAKIKIRSIPTYSPSCCPTARTPASPTIPMAKPEPRPDIPQQRPAASARNPSENLKHSAFSQIVPPTGALGAVMEPFSKIATINP